VEEMFDDGGVRRGSRSDNMLNAGRGSCHGISGLFSSARERGQRPGLRMGFACRLYSSKFGVMRGGAETGGRQLTCTFYCMATAVVIQVWEGGEMHS
jgi:hypothetical protein